MRIYVAGEVPRERETPRTMAERFFGEKSSSLSRLYAEIGAAKTKFAVSGQQIEVVLPWPDPLLDKLDARSFVEYVQSEIKKADAVLTVFTPPGIAVGFESRFAADLGKPQIVLLPADIRIPRWLQVLPGVVRIGRIGEIGMSEVVNELADATQRAGHEFGHYV